MSSDPNAHPMLADATDEAPAPEGETNPLGERLYAPAPGELQFTLRAVIVGCLLGGVVSAMNIYLGLRTGWSFGGSLISAILGFTVLGTLVKATGASAYTRLEANITQTAGSAAGSMASAAGLLAPIPALGMLGYEFAWWELVAWALAVAYLGVFFAVPLRRQMVVVEKLRFPTGTATAETILAMFASGEEARTKSRYLLGFGLFAGLFTLATYFVPPLEHPEITWGIFGVIGAWGFSVLLSPMMIGAGIIIGPRVGISLALGAIVGWGLVAPAVAAQGWAPGEIMSYADGVRGWILWPGVAIMVADALTRLALSWRTILNSFKRVEDTGEAQDFEPAEMIPNLWWTGGLAVSTVLTVGISYAVFDIPPVLTVLAVAMSAVLSMIAVRSTGETDINPIGGMGKITQLVFGAIAPGAVTGNLMTAAITGAGASQAGDMMQDLKTGHLLGASPRHQFKAQLIGIGFGVLFCVPVYSVFDAAYEMGGEELPAPAAHAWKAMAEVLSEGLGAMPPNALWAVLAGLVFGSLIAVLSTTLPKHVSKWLPSGLAFGIAFIVPAYYALAMCAGALILVAWQKARPLSATELSFAVASGLVAGEGIMGIGKAILTLLEVPTLM